VTSAREAAIAALHARLQLSLAARTPPPSVIRNETIPQRLPAGGLVMIQDGETVEETAILSPLRWQVRHVAQVAVIVPGATPEARAAALDGLLTAIAASLAGARTLGGAVEWQQPESPSFDDIDIDGAASARAAAVPVDLEFIGDWLRLLLGPPASSGANPDVVHSFVSGASPLPSNSIELAYPDVPNFDVIAGVRADTCEIDVSPSGAATATFGLIGQGSTRSATSSAGTPTTRDYVAFNKAQGSIRRNAAALAQITGGRLNYANGAEIVRTIRDDLRIEGVDPGLARATDQITSRFENTLLLDDAASNAALEVAFEYRISASRRLTVTLHQAYLSLAKTPIQGPAGIEAAFEFRAAFNAAAGRMMTVTLRNGVASYA
jgi:hypothetical protein